MPCKEWSVFNDKEYDSLQALMEQITHQSPHRDRMSEQVFFTSEKVTRLYFDRFCDHMRVSDSL